MVKEETKEGVCECEVPQTNDSLPDQASKHSCPVTFGCTLESNQSLLNELNTRHGNLDVAFVGSLLEDIQSRDAHVHVALPNEHGDVMGRQKHKGRF